MYSMQWGNCKGLDHTLADKLLMDKFVQDFAEESMEMEEPHKSGSPEASALPVLQGEGRDERGNPTLCWVSDLSTWMGEI